MSFQDDFSSEIYPDFSSKMNDGKIDKVTAHHSDGTSPKSGDSIQSDDVFETEQKSALKQSVNNAILPQHLLQNTDVQHTHIVKHAWDWPVDNVSPILPVQWTDDTTNCGVFETKCSVPACPNMVKVGTKIRKYISGRKSSVSKYPLKYLSRM